MSLTQNLEYPPGTALNKTVCDHWFGDETLRKRKYILKLQKKVIKLDEKYEIFGVKMELNRLLLISFTGEAGDPAFKRKPSSRFVQASKDARKYEKEMRKLSMKMSNIEDMIFDADEEEQHQQHL